MSNALKQTIYWSLFAVIALIVFLIILIPLFIKVYFPDANIVNNMTDVIGIASTVIGALSAGLGFLSIFQANKGNKQVNEILNKVNLIQSSQQAMFSKLSESGTSVGVGKLDPLGDGEWQKDPIKS